MSRGETGVVDTTAQDADGTAMAISPEYLPARAIPIASSIASYDGGDVDLD